MRPSVSVDYASRSVKIKSGYLMTAASLCDEVKLSR